MNKKVCVIGAGYWGKNHIRTLNRLNVLKGIVEIDSDILNTCLNKYPDVNGHSKIEDALNEDYDGFTIATPAKTHFQIAKVIIDKQSPFLRSVIINKGSNNNIKKGMAVLNNSYLVGKVVEVNFTTSRVLLLSDINSKIPISIEPGSIQSILSGNGDDMGIVQYSKNKLKLEKDQIVYTSGTGGLFKSGIPIGKITESMLNAKRNVEFFSDFSQLRFVNVALYEKKN